MKYIALVFLCVVFYSNAMEQECYLNQMPCDILNLIEHFLTCDGETEEQFIERIRAKNVEKQEKRKKKRNEPVNDVGIIRMLIASNLDKTKALLFYQNDCELTFYDYLDCPEGHINTQYVYKEERAIEYDSIALSPKGRMFACYHYSKCQCNEFVGAEPQVCVVEVNKINTQKKEDGNYILILQERLELYRGKHLYCDKIVFNKQGDQLMLYYSYTSEIEPIIFSLKNIDVTKPQAVVKTTNKLQEYLRDKCVCNKFIEGKK
jgi:hypothetical protein